MEKVLQRFICITFYLFHFYEIFNSHFYTIFLNDARFLISGVKDRFLLAKCFRKVAVQSFMVTTSFLEKRMMYPFPYILWVLLF